MLSLVGLLTGGAGAAYALPAELRGLVTSQRPAGCSEYSYLFWDLYRAELWSDARQLPGDRYGLSLTYLSEFSRDALVQSSVDEMMRMSDRPESTCAIARTENGSSMNPSPPGAARLTRRPVGFSEIEYTSHAPSGAAHSILPS